MNSHTEKLALLAILGFIPGKTLTEEGKENMKSLRLWAWGAGAQGKSPLQLKPQRIRQYIQFIGHSRYKQALSSRKAS